MNDYMNNLKDSAALGDEAKAFLNGAIGKEVLRRASEDEYACLRELAEADPSDAKTLTRLQIKAAGPRSFVRWINDILKDGKIAQHQLQQVEANKATY